MKKFNILIIFLVSLLFISNVSAEHISRYMPSFKPEKGILDNNIAIFVGVEGENVNKTEFTFSYDNRYLEFASFDTLGDNDEIRITKINEEGKWTTYKFDAQVESSSDYFGILMFKAKSNFKKNASTELFFYKYEGENENSKFRHDGTLLTLNRKSNDELVYQEELIDRGIQIKYWILEHLMLLIAICGLIILLIAIFLLMPLLKKSSKNIESKEEIKESPVETLGLYNKFEGNVVVNDKKVEENIELPKKIVPEGHETENGMYVYNPEFDKTDEK